MLIFQQSWHDEVVSDVPPNLHASRWFTKHLHPCVVKTLRKRLGVGLILDTTAGNQVVLGIDSCAICLLGGQEADDTLKLA